VFVGLTGLRPEEWLALERSDVDKGAGIVRVAARLYGRTSEALRQADAIAEDRPLPVRAAEALDDLPPRLDTRLLFPGERGIAAGVSLFEFARFMGTSVERSDTPSARRLRLSAGYCSRIAVMRAGVLTGLLGLAGSVVLIGVGLFVPGRRGPRVALVSLGLLGVVFSAGWLALGYYVDSVIE
jgi:integrase